VIVRDTTADGARSPTGQVTVDPVRVQPGDADTKVSADGKVSTIDTPTAVDGPLFVAVSV
jgi:hypothetical protein